MIGDTRTRIFLAVCAGHRTHGAIARALDLRLPQIDGHLNALRAAGLVDWRPHARGTIHPTVRVVACDPSMLSPLADAPASQTMDVDSADRDPGESS